MDTPASNEDSQDVEWAADDLEAAYLRALDALDAVDSEIVATAESVAPGRWQELEAQTDPPPAPPQDAIVSSSADTQAPTELQVTAEQIVEACLFVGGTSLTAARLSSVLRGNFDAFQVEQIIDQLNHQYLDEGRPYHIRLVDGGYQMVVREEYEPIRNKVFGLGPKEVKLSQEALEVLALVAYHQPATEARLEELGRPNAGSILRLLLRRDLIVMQRTAADSKAVQYVTTDRFLTLFGISSLNDLPRPEDLMFK